MIPTGSSPANSNLLLASQSKRLQIKNASKASFQAFSNLNPLQRLLLDRGAGEGRAFIKCPADIFSEEPACRAGVRRP